jgi:drug/metabolite transporter (DMT)-like permease
VGSSHNTETEKYVVMQMSRIAGAVLFAVGIVCLIFAYRAANAPLERIADTLTGRYSDQTMWYFILGVAGAVGGGLLFALGGRR